MLFLGTSWFDRDRDNSIADQLAGPLVKTDNWKGKISEVPHALLYTINTI